MLLIQLNTFPWFKINQFVYLYVRNSNPEGQGSSCKINGFPTKNVLKLNWAWQAYFLSHTLHILWEVISFKDKQMVKLWCWYLHWFQIYRKSVWVFRPYLEASLDRVDTGLHFFLCRLKLFKDASRYGQNTHTDYQ